MYKYELYHHGIIGQKWGVRNGPPYPLSESLSRRVGRKRAQKRIDYLEKKNTKKQTASASLTKQVFGLNMEGLIKQAKEILNSDDRLESFGRQTIINRATAFGAGHAAALGLAYIASAESLPIVLAGSAVTAGSSWIYYHYSKR